MTRGTRNRNGASRGKNAVMNARIVDPLAGADGARLDRMLSHMQNTHSQTRAVIGDYVPVSTNATATVSGVYTAANVRAAADWASFAAEFETYRITAIRFEVYDIQPAVPVFAALSTFHDVGSGFSVFTLSSILDGPDAQVPPAGGAKVALSWVAKGSQENDYQSTRTETGGAAPFDFGGLRYAIGSPGSVVSKYQVIVKAVVDFRGRL